jgi:DNA-directed RNA polymerase specialized sigma24 family protein
MVSFTASTRQPPAGGPKATVSDGDLLRRLRLGDRDAFIRYHRQFRAPVHHFAWRLLRDERSAVAATTEALVGVFRRAILDDGAGDLEALTYAAALAACEARAGAPALEEEPRPLPAGASEPRRRKHSAAEVVRQRFDAALESLEVRSRAVLLLHDLAGLGAARSGVVLGLEEEAAAALLFRAREEFRAALRERESYGGADGGCHQAEVAAAGAVGLGMGEEERSRLRSHAGYCRPCRTVMKDWTWTGAGLAMVLIPPPLPQALAATPVFGEVLARPAVSPAHRRVLGAARRTLRARTTAWVLAAACLAVAMGVTVRDLGVQPLVLAESVGPAIRLIVTLPSGEEPAVARSADRSTTAEAGAIGISAASTTTRSAATQTAGTARAPQTGPDSDQSTSSQSSGGGQDGQAAGEDRTVGGDAAQGDEAAANDAKAAGAGQDVAKVDKAHGRTKAGRDGRSHKGSGHERDGKATRSDHHVRGRHGSVSDGHDRPGHGSSGGRHTSPSFRSTHGSSHSGNWHHSSHGSKKGG